MKNKLLLILVIALFALFPLQKSQATIVYDCSPDDNEDHFIWDLMADLQTPDDPDCVTLAHAMLDADGTVPSGSHNEISTASCNGLAQLGSGMASGREEDGSETMTTNLSQATNWHSVSNLYFEHQTNGVADGRISFSETIDFMSYDFIMFLENFGDNMESRTGYISLDASTVGGFANYGATLTMYNVSEYDDPKILVNGGEDDGGIVSNLVYNRSAGTITFSAAHFTSFEVTEGDEEPEIDKIQAKKYFVPDLGAWRVKLKIKGDSFDDDTEVTVGGREANNVNCRSNEKIVASFSLDKLQRAGRDKLMIKVINGDESEKFNDRLTLSELTTEYAKLD